MIDWALHYAQRGWAVVPIHSVRGGKCSCSKGTSCKAPGKHPRTTSGVKAATTEEPVIRAWWERWPDSNVAIVMGAVSGIFAVDVDVHKGGYESWTAWSQGKVLEDTLSAKTGGGGRHYVYRYPTDGEKLPGRNPWLPGVDVKSDGGYVVAAPSGHISGGTYEWDDFDLEPIDPPAALVGDIRSTGGSNSGDLPATHLILAGVPEGERDITLFRAACRWRRLHQNEPDGGRASVTVLTLFAAANSTPPFPEDEALKKVESAFRQDHSDELHDDMRVNSHGRRHLTDDGNAHRLVDQFGDDLKYNGAFGWYRWNGKNWQAGADHDVMYIARGMHDIVIAEAEDADDQDTKTNIRKWAQKSESAGAIRAAEGLARTDPRVRTDPNDFDADPYLLHCPNGVVDLRTGELQPHNRNLLITLSTGVEYDPSYTMDAWTEFISMSCGDDKDLILYMQRALGQMLIGHNELELFYIVHGPAASGKSTFVDAVHAAMGGYAANVPSEVFMQPRGMIAQNSERALVQLAGKRVVTASESGEGDRINEALIKQITGGDIVTVRELYKERYSYRPQFVPLISTNYEPMIRDTAIWRRIRMVPFPNVVPKERRNPKLKLNIRDRRTGAKAVLAWGVAGAIDFIRNPYREDPDAVTVRTAEYQRDQDRLGHFLSEELIRDSSARLTMKELFERYLAWCNAFQEHHMMYQNFKTRIKDREGYMVERDNDVMTLHGFRLRNTPSTVWTPPIAMPQPSPETGPTGNGGGW